MKYRHSEIFTTVSEEQLQGESHHYECVWIREQHPVRNAYFDLTMRTINLAERLALTCPENRVLEIYAVFAKRIYSHQVAIDRLVAACRYGEALLLLRPLAEVSDSLQTLKAGIAMAEPLMTPAVSQAVIRADGRKSFQDVDIEAEVKGRCSAYELEEEAMLFPLIPYFDQEFAVCALGLANTMLPVAAESFSALCDTIFDDLSFKQQIDKELENYRPHWQALSHLESDFKSVVEEIWKRTAEDGESRDTVIEKIIERYGFDLHCSCH